MSTTNQANGPQSPPPTTTSRIPLRIQLPPTLSTPLTTLLTTTEPHRAALTSTLRAHPVLTSFLLCQLLCSTVPIALFLAGVAISASLAASAFACLALLVVGPVLVFTSLLGVWVWGFAWATWVVGRWVWGFRVVDEAPGAGVEVKEEEEDKEKEKGMVVEEKEVGG